jgi:NAD(P)-dependent dehydrogenase (short-subunit alcohol dehydrogenase family)
MIILCPVFLPILMGAYVFITGRRQSELDAAVNQIGKTVTGVQGDVSNLADLDRLYATVKQQKGLFKYLIILVFGK